MATLKIKNKKCEPEKVFNLVKDSLETGLIRENFNECLGDLISNKSVKHNTINTIAAYRKMKLPMMTIITTISATTLSVMMILVL